MVLKVIECEGVIRPLERETKFNTHVKTIGKIIVLDILILGL
jgi:hypothetical protein